MSKITWDALGERIYEVGLDHGVIYLPVYDEFSNAIPWNGLTKVSDPGIDVDSGDLFSGDIKVGSEEIYSEYTGSIEALTYPDEFEECLGNRDACEGIYFTRRERTSFGLSYRTLVGSDTEGTNKGYKIHLLYNVKITKHDRTYQTLSDSTDLSSLKWDFVSIPYMTQDNEPINHIVLDMSNIFDEFRTFLEDTLYGTDETPARLLMPDEIISEFYNHYSRWTGNPSNLIYPSPTVYPAFVEEQTN